MENIYYEYVRTSTNDRYFESSMYGQSNLLDRYAEKNNLYLKDLFIDDGKECKDLRKMIKKINAGGANCILVKGLSKLSRDTSIWNSIWLALETGALKEIRTTMTIYKNGPYPRSFTATLQEKK
jgi:hypothetical protein